MVSINGMPYGYIAVRDDYDDTPNWGTEIDPATSPIIAACKKHKYISEWGLTAGGYHLEVHACMHCGNVKVKRFEGAKAR